MDQYACFECCGYIISTPRSSSTFWRFQVASAISGAGVRIGRAIIQSCKDCQITVDDEDFDGSARLFKFWGTDRCESCSMLPNAVHATVQYLPAPRHGAWS
jgi:hypothetical protein